MARASHSEKELYTRLRSSSQTSLSFQGIFAEIKSGKVLDYQLQVKIGNEQLIITSYSVEGRTKSETIPLSHICLDIFDDVRRRFCIHYKDGGLRVFQLCNYKSTSPNHIWVDLVDLIRQLSARKEKPLVGKSIEFSTRITCCETASKALFTSHHIEQNIIFEYFFVELNLKGLGINQLYLGLTEKHLLIASQTLNYLTLKEQIPLQNVTIFIISYTFRRIGIFIRNDTFRIFEMCNFSEKDKNLIYWNKLVDIINMKDQEPPHIKQTVSDKVLTPTIPFKDLSVNTEENNNICFGDSEDQPDIDLLTDIQNLFELREGERCPSMFIDKKLKHFAGVFWNTSLESSRNTLLRKWASCPEIHKCVPMSRNIVEMVPSVTKSSSFTFVTNDDQNWNLCIQCSSDKFIDEINDNTLLALSRKVMLVQGYKKDIVKLWSTQEKIRDYKYYTRETVQFSPYLNRSNSVEILNYVRKFEKRNKADLVERMSIYSLKLPTKLLSTKRQRIMTKGLSNIEAEHLACELTYVNKILLLKVRIDDIQHINAKSISEMYLNNTFGIWMTFSEQMRNMVVAEVVNQNDIQDRLQAMRYFMKVAIICWKIQNFNTTANILCAFHSPAIYHQKKTWNWFKMKYPFTYHSFQKMSSIFFEDNCRSYRNAFRKAIDNPPYIPWISHFLNHTIIPTWKTYIHGWKKTRIRNLLKEKLTPLQGRNIINTDLYFSELKNKSFEENSLKSKTRSYMDKNNISDSAVNLVGEEQPKIIPIQSSTKDSSVNEPAVNLVGEEQPKLISIQSSTKYSSVNEENRHDSTEKRVVSYTTPHEISYKEFTPLVNKCTKVIKDTGARGYVSRSLSMSNYKDKRIAKDSISSVNEPAVNLVGEEQPKLISIQSSTKDSSVNEENRHDSTEKRVVSYTTPHAISYKEFSPLVNKCTKVIKDTGARGYVSRSLPMSNYKDKRTANVCKTKLNLSLGQLEYEGISSDLTKKKAYRFRTHYQVQHYHFKPNQGESENLNATKHKSDSNQTPSTSSNIPNSSPTSNDNAEDNVSTITSISSQHENMIKESGISSNKEKTSKEEQHNEESVHTMNQVVFASAADENHQETQISGGKSIISTSNTENSDNSEVIEISQNYIKDKNTREIYETVPKSNFSELNVLNKNGNNELVSAKEQKGETCFTMDEEVKNTCESEIFQEASASLSTEKINETFSDISGRKSSFKNISKEYGTFENIPEVASSLKLIHEETSVLEHIIEEASSLENISEETVISQTIPEEASAFKNIPGKDGALQTIPGKATTFNKISEEARIVDKFREVASAFKTLREEILCLEKIPEETDAFENILHGTDAFDKIRDVTGALEMFFKEVGTFEILPYKDDAFEKIREIADVVKAILEEVGGHGKVSEETGNNISNMLVNEVTEDTHKQINSKQVSKIREVPLQSSFSKSSISSKGSTKSLNYMSNKTFMKNTNEKEVKEQCVRFNISKSDTSTKKMSKISSRSMSDVRKPNTPSRLPNQSFKGYRNTPPAEVSKAKPMMRKTSKNPIQNTNLNKCERKIETTSRKECALQVKNKLSKQTVSHTEKEVSSSLDGRRCVKGKESGLHLNKEKHVAQNLNRSALNLRDKMRSKIREILLNKYKENCSSNSHDQTLYNFYKTKGGKNNCSDYFDLWECPLCGCDICIYADLPQSLVLCFQKAANCYSFQSQYNVRTFLKSYIFIEMEKLFTESKK